MQILWICKASRFRLWFSVCKHIYLQLMRLVRLPLSCRNTLNSLRLKQMKTLLKCSHRKGRYRLQDQPEVLTSRWRAVRSSRLLLGKLSGRRFLLSDSRDTGQALSPNSTAHEISQVTCFLIKHHGQSIRRRFVLPRGQEGGNFMHSPWASWGLTTPKAKSCLPAYMQLHLVHRNNRQTRLTVLSL